MANATIAQQAPERVSGAYVIKDGRYGGTTVQVALEVTDDKPVSRNGRRWEFAMDYTSALKLHRALTIALRAAAEGRDTTPVRCEVFPA